MKNIQINTKVHPYNGIIWSFHGRWSDERYPYRPHTSEQHVSQMMNKTQVRTLAASQVEYRESCDGGICVSPRERCWWEGPERNVFRFRDDPFHFWGSAIFAMAERAKRGKIPSPTNLVLFLLLWRAIKIKNGWKMGFLPFFFGVCVCILFTTFFPPNGYCYHCHLLQRVRREW